MCFQGRFLALARLVPAGLVINSSVPLDFFADLYIFGPTQCLFAIRKGRKERLNFQVAMSGVMHGPLCFHDATLIAPRFFDASHRQLMEDAARHEGIAPDKDGAVE